MASTQGRVVSVTGGTCRRQDRTRPTSSVRQESTSDGAGAGHPLAPPEGASVGKQWRFRRNLVIYVARRAGLSQRMLADVFDLPRSRIAAILEEMTKFE